jgi:hypothetical protein
MNGIGGERDEMDIHVHLAKELRKRMQEESMGYTYTFSKGVL